MQCRNGLIVNAKRLKLYLKIDIIVEVLNIMYIAHSLLGDDFGFDGQMKDVDCNPGFSVIP